MNNARRRKNLMLRRISGETEQSSEISSTQENLVGQCSNLFTITDVRSLSEQNYEHNELIPTNQALDVSCATRADIGDLLQPNRFKHPFFSNVYVEDNVQQFINQSSVDLLNSINLMAAPNTVNDGNFFTETVRESEATNDENIANNNTSASVNKLPRSTEQNPAVVLNDISNSDKIGKLENHVQAIDDTQDEFISFEEKLTKHFRQMPLRSALLLQKEIQDIIILERLKCLDEQ